MKKDLTELVFVLDASGSMYSMTQDTIGGFNSMIAKQKKEEGDALVTTYTFNDSATMVHDRAAIGGVAEMTEKDYVAGGCTALIDAIGGAVEHISQVHRYIRKEDVPEHTLFVITTDGLENASRRYSSDDVKKMISAKKELGWEFLFLGANIDAVDTAAGFGIDRDHAVDFVCDREAMPMVMNSVSEAISSNRRCGKVAPTWKNEIAKDYAKRGKKK